MASASPDFPNPPVIELVLGIQFDPLKNITNGHLGCFWGQLSRGEWPTASDANRLSDQIEAFAAKTSWAPPAVGFQLLSQAGPQRLRIESHQKDRLIQVQDTRFVYNWVKQKGKYPRYVTIRGEFDDYYARFKSFVEAAELDLGELRPNQWEVTYVNHIPRGELWEHPSQWSNVLPGLLKEVSTFGNTEFESTSAEWRSVIPAKRGRLHITIRFQEMKRPDDEAEGVLVLHLTARGGVSEELDFEAGLELGHKTIVKAFLDITSPDAQMFWEKEKEE